MATLIINKVTYRNPYGKLLTSKVESLYLIDGKIYVQFTNKKFFNYKIALSECWNIK